MPICKQFNRMPIYKAYNRHRQWNLKINIKGFDIAEYKEKVMQGYGPVEVYVQAAKSKRKIEKEKQDEDRISRE